MYKIRHELAQHFAGIGVEVGVRHGWFSDVILKYGNVDRLYGVDVENRISKHVIENPRFTFVNKTSLEAVQEFNDESLDFVYIDADHSYKSVVEDIQAWKQKVKRGGILSGHDYDSHFTPDVVKAVEEFFPEVNITGLPTGASKKERLEWAKIAHAQEYPEFRNFKFDYDRGDKCPSWWVVI